MGKQAPNRVDIESLLTALPQPVVPAGFVEWALARPVEVGRAPVAYAVFALPFGNLHIAFGETVLLSQVDGHSVEFEDRIREELRARPEPVDPPVRLRAAVERFAQGSSRLDFPVQLERVKPFQRRVLVAALAIPRGRVATYQRIAQDIGAPGAARAVGTALAKNPIPVILPCHRVVRADARLGEYSGGGAPLKARILRWEGVPVESRRGTLMVAEAALATA